MLASGWIEEAESLMRKGLHESPTAWQALGYRQIAAYLNGEIKRGELQERITTATWQFARRQNTWFRTQHPEAVRIRMPDPDAEAIVEQHLRNAPRHFHAAEKSENFFHTA
jgi:tRNA dimethylallyltransferase